MPAPPPSSTSTSAWRKRSAGTVSARNEALETQPELMNSDPYGEGWVVEIELQDASVLDSLLDAGGYQQLLED